MKTFVTGGTGFVGRRLIDELLAHGYEVAALVRTFDRARTLPDAVRTVPGDVTKAATLRAGLRDAEVVFHLAAWRGVPARAKGVERMARINVEGTRVVLEAAAAAGVGCSVYVSSLDALAYAAQAESADGREPAFDSEYARSKYRAHFEVARPLQAQGAPVVIVCPGDVFGPGDASPLGRLLRQFSERRLPVLAGGDAELRPVFVDDVTAGLRLAAERGEPGAVYALAGPPISYREFFAAAQRATGLPAPRVWLPGGLAGVAGGARPRPKADPPPAAAEAAARDLGWQPRPLEQALAETVAWLQAEAARPPEPPPVTPAE